MHNIERSVKILIGLIVLSLLYVSSLYNYLLFHTLAEVFSICIAVTVFLVTWNAAHVIQNKYLLLVGFAYLFIGFMDLMHTISYPGMAIITDYDYHANQVWLAARYFESGVLLSSFLLVKKKNHFNPYLRLSIYAVVTTVLMLTIFAWHIFPVCYVAGAGQTSFKIISEYIIIAILIAALFVLQKNKAAFDAKVKRNLCLSLHFTIASEICFTLYINSYDFTNLLGHYFKIFSFYLIYRTLIQTGIREPYDLIFREMKQTAQQLYEQNVILSNKTIADDLTLQEHLDLLGQQYTTLTRQAKLLDLSHEAIFVWDLYGAIIYWNRGAELMYGYTAEEAIGRRSDGLLKTKHSISLQEKLLLLEQNGTWSGELVHSTKDGKEIIVEAAHQVYVEEDGRKIVLELCRDVTEKIEAENEIRKSAFELKNIINSTEDFIWSVDPDYKIIFCNKAVYEFIKEYYNFELKPGLPVLEHMPAEIARAYRDLLNRVKTDGEFTVDMHSYRGDKYLTFSFHPIFVDNQLVEITAFGRNTTNRIKAEQEVVKLNASLETRIQERTKELRGSLETNRNFIIMMTHDLKTQLHEIEAYTNRLRNKAGCEQIAERISGLSTDMSTMITKLIDYDRMNTAEVLKEPIAIRELIDAVFCDLKSAYTQDRAVIEYQTGLPEIYADKTMMRRVILNLLSNALKFSAMRDKPRIVVGCRREKNEFVFYIKDNGIGFNKEYAEKLFNIFERLHSTGEFEGHGIGLASVRSMISKHGGRTWIDGKLNRGTTVCFTIPVELSEVI